MRFFFGNSPTLRDDFEECLFAARQRVLPTMQPQDRSNARAIEDAVVNYYLNDVEHDENAERHGAPALSLIHFFKRDDIGFPAAFVQTPDDVRLFVMSLYSVLIWPLERCAEARHYNVEGAWICPCETGVQCGILSRAIQTRLSVLMLAAQVAQINNRGHVLNNVYACIDSHSKFLCAVQRRVAEIGDKPRELGRLCWDDQMGPLLAANPVSMEYAFTIDSVPDTSPLLPLAMAYNSSSNGASNKKIFQCKYPYLSADNIDRMEKLHRLIYKGLPTRCFNRQLWMAIRRCCVMQNSKLKTTKIDHEFVVFFFRIIIAAVLGVYRGAQKLEDINARIHIYSAIHSHVSISSILDILTVNNKWTLLYITREYLREMIGTASGVLEALRRTYKWDTNIAYIDQIMCITRAQVRANMAGLSRRAAIGSWASMVFRGVDVRIQAPHNRSRTTQREKTVDYDLYAILKSLFDTNLKKYVYDMDQQGEYLGREFLMRPPNPVLTVSNESGAIVSNIREKVMRQVIATFPKNRFIPLDWLVCFGAKWADIIAIRAALFQKMARLLGILHAMRVNDPPSYAIFYTFFRLCKEHQDYREYYGDAFMYLRHAQALHKAHQVPVNGKIPRVLGKLYVCRSCNDFKRMSFFRPIKRKSNDGTGICRIAADGRIVCGRKHKAANWRELHKFAAATAKKAAKRPRVRGPRRAATIADDDDADDAEDGANMESLTRFFSGQIDDNFDPLHDIGLDVVAEQDDDDDECADENEGDFLPEAKGNVKIPSERVQRRKFARHVNLQHTLNQCHDNELHVINVLGRVVDYQRAGIMGCFRCLRPMPLLQAIDSGLDKICGECHQKERAAVPRVRLKCEAVHCINKSLTPAEAYSILVYDNDHADPAKHRYRTMTLCKAHAGLGWVKNTDTIHTVKYITRGLTANWGTCRGPNGSYVPVLPEEAVDDV